MKNEKAKTCKKSSFLNEEWGGGVSDTSDDRLVIQIILQNAPFRSQIFKIFFASGGKGALTPRPVDALARNPQNLSQSFHLKGIRDYEQKLSPRRPIGGFSCGHTVKL